MDDLEEITALKQQETAEENYEEEDEEHNEEETEEYNGGQEQTSEQYESYSSTDTTIDLSEYKYLLHEASETVLEFPSPPINVFESDEEKKMVEEEVEEEEETLKTKSGSVEILSEQTEISDESAWEKEVPEPQQIEESIIEELTEDSLETTRDTKDEPEEIALEQTFVETEETEQEEEEGEEEMESEMFAEWEKEQKIAQFYKDLEELLSYEFPEDMTEEEEMKLQMYESMLRELEKEDKEIDVMLKELDKNEKTIHVIEKTLGPLITHYEKEVSAFRKIGDDGFADLEEEEGEEDVEDEYRSRAAEMAKEILEADDIESVGSLGKESSGDDLSNMLSQMAADLKDSEPEPAKEEQTGQRKTPVRLKRKPGQGRRVSKTSRTDVKRKKK